MREDARIRVEHRADLRLLENLLNGLWMSPSANKTVSGTPEVVNTNSR